MEWGSLAVPAWLITTRSRVRIPPPLPSFVSDRGFDPAIRRHPGSAALWQHRRDRVSRKDSCICRGAISMLVME